MHYLSFRSFDVSFVPFISHLLSQLIPCINPPKMSHLKKKRALKRDRATRITATNFYLRIRPPIATNSMPRIATLQQSQLFCYVPPHIPHRYYSENFYIHCRRTANNKLFAGPYANFEETKRAFLIN